jgi:hypothetical protein
MTSVFCRITEVKVNIPFRLLSRLFDSHKPLTHKEYIKISRKSRQIEAAINQLQHYVSVIDRIKLKGVE